MKRTLVLFVTSLLAAGSALADPTPRPQVPAGAPAGPAKQFSKLTIDTVKPTLMQRNVFAIRGTHAAGVDGGWTVDATYQINKDTKVVQVTLVASAPSDKKTTATADKLETKVEIKELAAVTTPVKYDIVVVDRDGSELARGVFEKK